MVSSFPKSVSSALLFHLISLQSQFVPMKSGDLFSCYIAASVDPEVRTGFEVAAFVAFVCSNFAAFGTADTR